ncbi:McrB family protein [Paenibacillus ihumii]|uniref:McrB family protein n=1 Tax=Paenibacillus ihumii TaxID=687436 RepID=UPI0006D7EFE8|nr:AAA family ATPase [Paenibacillus ihumii]
MITQVRSWTHDDSIPNLIGRKKVDWSIFEYGSAIPNDFIPFFDQANHGEVIEVGNPQRLTLIWENKRYQAVLRIADQKGVGRDKFQMNYRSNEIKELMKSVFRSTYEYMLELKDKDSGSRKQISVPNELAEYIEFYSTDKPFVYEMKLLPVDDLTMPNIWWVNQGSTLNQEFQEGILWAPLTGKGGRSQYHWDTMDEVRKGDIILHYANGALRYVSRAIADPVNARKPSSMSNSIWEEQGRLIRAEYFALEPNIPLSRFSQEVLNLNIHQGPIHSGGGVKQGYLFRFSIEGLNIIQSHSPDVAWPEFTRFEVEDNEDLDEVEPVQMIIEDGEVAAVLSKIKAYIQQRGFYYPPHLIENFYLSLKTKPFVILAGVSGTGKTRLIKLFAEAMGANLDNGQYTQIPVRPDWSDPSDLIGYSDLAGKYRPGPLAKVLLKASQNPGKPYFICLDEMNLARVEHYFSDMLSILETQEWQGDRIVTAPIIHEESLVQDEDRVVYGNLSIPENLYLIGTVNMDETTHPFSKKVLDRANTIEFNDIYLPQFPKEEPEAKLSPEPVPNQFLRSDYLRLVDAFHADTKAFITKTTEALVRINNILEEIHAHVGFRTRDAVCFYMLYSQRYKLFSEEEALDRQLLQKILPRIQGSSASIRRALLNLMKECIGPSFVIKDYSENMEMMFEERKLNELINQAKYPQSAKKIASMLRRLEEDGFTSYWLS